MFDRQTKYPRRNNFSTSPFETRERHHQHLTGLIRRERKKRLLAIVVALAYAGIFVASLSFVAEISSV